MKRFCLVFFFVLFSSPSYSGGWCGGSPICPGDIVSDYNLASAREALKTAMNEFHETKKMVALINKTKNDILLKGNEMQADINESIMKISKETQSETDIYNEKIIRDMQPADIDACNVISLVNNSVDCEIESEKNKLMNTENNGKSYGKAVSDFYGNYEEKFKENQPLMSPSFISESWIGGEKKEAAVAAIDILTDKNLRERNIDSIDIETNSGKVQAVDSVRKDIVNNIARDGLLQSVVNRSSGNSNRPSKIQYMEQGVANFFGDQEIELPPEDDKNEQDPYATVEDALLSTIPALKYGNKDKILSCLDAAVEKNGMDRNVMLSIMAVEGGRVGTESKNKNGSIDYGIMQINTATINDLRDRFGLNYTIEQIRDDECTNIDVSAKVLAQKIKEAGDKWEGIGDYNSRNEPAHSIYKDKIFAKYQYLTNGTMPQSMGDSAASDEVLTSQMWRRMTLLSAMEMKIELENYKKWSSIETKKATKILNGLNGHGIKQKQTY